ncbi:MAG: carboxymuconolactone decarboxylase family protein [Gaiellales bacterium]
MEDPDLVDAVLDDWRAASLDGRLRAALGFIETLTLHPSSLSELDAEAARQAGVEDAALADVVDVCAAFSILNRLADALGWELLDDETFDARAPASLERGYALRPADSESSSPPRA